ncbi:MAG: type II 3-dehydroquinate dehydratase [Pseudomonadales bacterium]
MASILVLNGPNLNLLGMREPSIYGASDLSAINERLLAQAERAGHTLRCEQSNAEHELIAHIHAVLSHASVRHAAASDKPDWIIFNPAAFTHTSIALRDALLAVGTPFFEVHLSNVHVREVFRQHSYFSDIAAGVICGLGAYGYELALAAAIQRLT